MTEIIQKIQFKRGNKVDLELVLKGANKLASGEPAFELDTGKLKIGNGIDNYVDLPYLAGGGYEEQIVFGTRYEFPAIGEENKLYIAKDEQNAYIWKTNKYELISVDHSVNEIDGGGANTIF